MKCGRHPVKPLHMVGQQNTAMLPHNMMCVDVAILLLMGFRMMYIHVHVDVHAHVDVHVHVRYI